MQNELDTLKLSLQNAQQAYAIYPNADNKRLIEHYQYLIAKHEPTIEPQANVGQIDRATYIGSSDAAAILGVSPWSSALDVYLDKTEGRREVSAAKQKIFNRGVRMEKYIIDILSEQENLTITKRGARYRDNDFPFIAAEIDAETWCGRNVEIKTVSPFKAKEWGEQQTDEVPMHYIAQVMHGLMVTNREETIMGVLIGGDDFRVYRIFRDDEIIDLLKEKEIEFWDRIQNLNPPEPVTLSDMSRLYRFDIADAIETNGDIAIKVARYAEIGNQIKELELEQDILKANIQAYMGNHSILTIDSKPLLTWKSQSRTTFDSTRFKADHPELADRYSKTASSRVFRLK